MLGKTHKAAGLAAGAAACIAAHADLMPGVVFLACTEFGALLPDIDHKNSTITQKVKPVGTVVSIIAGHRGIFHDPITYAVIGTAAFALRPDWKLIVAALLLGIATHLVLDAMNPKGIPNGAIFHGSMVHVAKIKTGSMVDRLLGAIFSTIAAVAVLCWLAKDLLNLGWFH